MMSKLVLATLFNKKNHEINDILLPEDIQEGTVTNVFNNIGVNDIGIVIFIKYKLSERLGLFAGIYLSRRFVGNIENNISCAGQPDPIFFKNENYDFKDINLSITLGGDYSFNLNKNTLDLIPFFSVNIIKNHSFFLVPQRQIFTT